MRLPLALLLSTAILVAAFRAAGAAPAPHPVEMAGADGRLGALLYKPEGDGPFPAVIALHDCGGLKDKSGAIKSHLADWAKLLLKAGHAVLLPDSYGSREVGSQCHAKSRRVLARRERVVDIAAARRWLDQQAWTSRQRISLIGWGNGASALLWAVRPQLARDKSGPEFRAAVAFYPDCRLSARLGWSARVPTLLLIGGNDDVSSPPSCRAMVDGARGRSALARIVVYPAASHGFDRAGVRLPPGSPADPDDADQGYVGFDPAARRDAEKRVMHWLGR